MAAKPFTIVAVLVSGSGIYVAGASQAGMTNVDANICEMVRTATEALRLNQYAPSSCHIVPVFVYAWLCVAAIAALYVLYRAAFWALGQHRRALILEYFHRVPANAIGILENGNKKPKQRLKINIGTGGSYEFVAPAGVNMARVIRIKIENNTNRFISNGSLSVLNLDPPPRGYTDWLLNSAIVIKENDYTFVDVAGYTEGTSKYPPGTFISLIAPAQTGAFIETRPLLPVQSHKFRLRFSTVEGDADEVSCRLFVDSKHVLRLEDWGDSARHSVSNAAGAASPAPEYLSLYEVARRLIDGNFGIYDLAARQLAVDGDGPIPWWANWVGLKTKIYGKLVPARTMREFPIGQYYLKVEGETIVGVEKWAGGSERWEDLSIIYSELPNLLIEAKKGAGE